MGLKGNVCSILPSGVTQKEDTALKPAMSKGKVGSKKVLAFCQDKGEGADAGSGRGVPFACQHLGYFSTWASIQQLVDAHGHSSR